MDPNISKILLVFGIVLLLFLFMVPLTNRLNKKRTYSLGPAGTGKLEIRANNSWRRVEVFLDGVLVGKVNHKRALFNGVEFALPDGSTLKLQLIQLFLSYAEMQVWHNGVPLQDFSGLSGRPLNINKGGGAAVTIGLLPFIWLITLVCLRLLINHSLHFTAAELPVIFAYIAWGVLFLVLGFLAYRKSTLALILAALLYLLDGIIGTLIFWNAAASVLSSGQNTVLKLFTVAAYSPFAIGFVIVHLFLLVLLLQGCAALVTYHRDHPSPVSRITTLIAALLIIAAVVGVFWEASSNPALLNKLNGFYTQASSILTPISNQPESPVKTTQTESSNANGSLCWTKKVSGFSGNRSQAWETQLDPQVKYLLPFDQFKEEVLVRNPQLVTDSYIFNLQKTYLFPAVCP
jgi:hypothetical protein